MVVDLSHTNPLLGTVGQGLRFRSGTARDAATARARIEEFKRHVEQRQHAAFKRILLEALTGLAQATPVDTGHARKNWQVTLAPVAQELQGVDPQGKLTAANAMRVISAIPLRTKRAYLVNPVPYMERLNQGWSKQAPKGWIDSVFQRILQKYARVK